jgi:hypothetical protein
MFFEVCCISPLFSFFLSVEHQLRFFFWLRYTFAFGDGSNPNPFIGTTNLFLMDVDDYAFLMFHYALSAASAAILVAGTLAERCQIKWLPIFVSPS